MQILLLNFINVRSFLTFWLHFFRPKLFTFLMISMILLMVKGIHFLKSSRTFKILIGIFANWGDSILQSRHAFSRSITHFYNDHHPLLMILVVLFDITSTSKITILRIEGIFGDFSNLLVCHFYPKSGPTFWKSWLKIGHTFYYFHKESLKIKIVVTHPLYKINILSNTFYTIKISPFLPKIKIRYRYNNQ